MAACSVFTSLIPLMDGWTLKNLGGKGRKIHHPIIFLDYFVFLVLLQSSLQRMWTAMRHFMSLLSNSVGLSTPPPPAELRVKGQQI